MSGVKRNFSLEIEISFGGKNIKSVYPGIIGGQFQIPMRVSIGAPLGTISVEIFPAAVELIFGISVLEIADNVISVNDIPDGSFSALIDRLRHQNSIDKHKDTLDLFFLKKCTDNERAAFFHHCVELIYRSSGNIPVSDLHCQFQLSKRQFERRFKECVGTSASMMRRFVRSNCALTKILNGGDVNDIVFELGYFDQSHLIKDIKWYTGKTPKSLFENCRNGFFRLGDTTYMLD